MQFISKKRGKLISEKEVFSVIKKVDTKETKTESPYITNKKTQIYVSSFCEMDNLLMVLKKESGRRT